ncbi:MAG: polyprenyl synthetase family protein [Prevotellaceae bacterium]|jgi:geranylgeranyl diphosphate synthase type II|nr:polyprenyl synthetase family protein [Prevotellaceae bacterium]
MYSAEDIKELVEKSLKGIQYPDGPQDLYAPVTYSLSIGGKRIRPILSLLSCNLFTDRVTDKCVLPATGLEIFHCFTLVHDDIMDKADMRRNQPSIHKKWNINTAILSGDAMCIESYKLMCYAETAKLSEILQSFNKAALSVCEGQQYDMNYENKTTVTEDDYLKMIELKTAALISVSTKIGAILGGAPSSDIDRLTRLGHNLGLAFQIQDDILDSYSDSKKMGKDTGLDIANNKKTYLLTAAIRLAKGEQKKKLISLMNDKNILFEQKYSGVREIYDNLKVKDLAEAKVKEYFAVVEDELKAVDVKPERKNYFKEFIDSLFGRQK